MTPDLATAFSQLARINQIIELLFQEITRVNI
jgi:hypothetical protein